MIPYLKFAPYVAIFAAGFLINGWRLNATISELKAQHSAIVAAAAQEAKQKESEFRAKERKWQKEIDDANQSLLAQQSKNRAIAADFERTNSGLRDAIQNYATNAGAAEDTISACRARTATIGTLLEQSVRLQQELAADAESVAADARAMYESWPK